MANENHLLEAVLRECRSRAPAPFYPSQDAGEKWPDRTALDQALDQLRLAGLLKLTPWEAGRGQGYALTPDGEEVLQSPRLLSRLQTHGAEPKRVEPLAAPSNAGRPMTPWERGEAVRAVLVRGGKPRVTTALIFLCIGVFLMGVSLAVQKGLGANSFLFAGRGAMEILMETGAINRESVVEDEQWWRLISYQFVHIGMLHIVLNMFFLFNVGQIVEIMWGHFRFLLLYLISGIGGGCAVVVLNPEANLTAGASGALCGIFASMAVWIVWNKPHLPPQMVSSTLRQLLINAMIIALLSTLPNVSWAGHLGGAVAGVVVSVPLMLTRFGTGWQRWLGWLGVLAVPVVCVAYVEGSRPVENPELVRTQAAMRAFYDARRVAIETFNEHVVDLLNEPEKHDDEDRSQAGKVFKDASSRLQSALTTVQATEPLATERNRDFFSTAAKYLQTWKSFYDDASGCLISVQGCSDQQRQQFLRTIRELKTMQDKLSALVK